MSLCDTCREPGSCCRAIPLSQVFPPDMDRETVTKHVQAGTDPWGSDRKFEPVPSFEALRPNRRMIHRGQREPHSLTWFFECRALTSQGRCGIYKNRPKLCRVYEPQSDPLCIHYEGPWRGLLRIYAEKE